MKVCWELFSEIEIAPDGNVFFCCAQRVSKRPLGNIFEQNFEEIWNGDLAVKMRENALLENKYPFCNHEICHKLSGNTDLLFDVVLPFYSPVMKKYPIQVSFPIGEECNAKCIFCRDKIYSTSEEEFNDFKFKLNKYFIPILKNTQCLTVTDTGDAFGSRTSREVIKVVSQKYPDIKFKIMTNGVCASKKIIEELGIPFKIREMAVSINAVTPETHFNIFRIKGWDILLNNLQYLSELKKIVTEKDGSLFHFHFKFVVCNENWKEMAAFVPFSRRYGAKIDFWEVRDYHGNDPLEHSIKTMAVYNENHPDFEKFKKSLANPIFDGDDITFSPVLVKIRHDSLEDIKKIQK